MPRNSRRAFGKLASEDGYTLTEILVVMAIIGLIAAVLTPGLLGQLGRARAKTASLQLESVAAAVEMFRSDTGRYPTNSEGLNALVSQPANAEGWQGPYLKNPKMLTDPWGHAETYTLADTGLTYIVGSYGADGAEGGTGLNKDLQAQASQ